MIKPENLRAFEIGVWTGMSYLLIMQSALFSFYVIFIEPVA
jgi:hypothetical protein